MQILPGPGQTDLETGDAAQAVSDRRLAGGELRRVADHGHVALKLFAVGGQKGASAQILAADLFFAFDHEFEPDRQPADGAKPSLGTFDVS